MLKKLVVNILLKRGASAAEEALGKAIRHGMTTYGGVLMSQGLANADQVTALTGGAVAIGGIVLSLVRIWMQQKLQ